MLSRKRPRVSSATGTWKPRKKSRLINRGSSSGIRTGGWRGVPGRRGELKYVDQTQNNTVIPTLGTLILLNGIAPGTGASQRIGKKVNIKSIQFRCSIGGAATGVTPFQGFVRFLWIYDKQTNATTPTVANILEATSGVSPMNMDNRDRFVVISDKQYAIDQSGGHQSGQIKMYKKLNLTTVFNAGTAGTVADITSGAIYLLHIASSAVSAPTNNPVFTHYNRIRYDDS